MSELAAGEQTQSAGFQSRLFVSAPTDDRPRRAGHAVILGLGLLLVAANAWVSERTLRVEETVVDLVGSLPSWADEAFAWTYGFAGIFALWLLVAAVARRSPRWDIARDVILAGATALAIGLVLARLFDGEWPIVFPELGQAEPAARFPVLRVALVSAVVLVVGPHTVRPVRRMGLFFVGLVAVSGLGLGLGVPSDAIGGVGLGMAAAGAVLLSLGTPAGHPDSARVKDDLAALGLSVHNVRPAPQQTWGVQTLLADDDQDRPVLIKVYGRDARDAQLLARGWRVLWYRDEGPSVSASRLEQVEHEALVTLLAVKAGVACPEVLAAAASDEDDAVLVIEHHGTRLTEMDPSTVDWDLLARVWSEVQRLHEAGITHGTLHAANVRVYAGRPILTNLAAGSLLPSLTRMSIDVVELLVSLAEHVGVKRAVQTAHVTLGPGKLADAIPYMQLPAISTTTRRAIDEPKDLVRAVKAEAVEVTGVEAPEPAKLRRIGVRDLVFTGLMVLAAYFLIQQIAGLDLQEIWESLKTAEWGWVTAAFITAQMLLIPNATGMMAAVSAPIPLRPTVILQSAIQFIGLAVPSSAGRIATNVAYLRKYGVSAVTAVTQGALDSFTGFLVQAAILVGALLFGDLSFGLGGDFDLNWRLILGVAAAVIVAGLGVLFVVKSLRERVLSGLSEAIGALRGLLEEPRRAILLFGSNFSSQLTLAITMWLMIRAFGETASLATALVVVVGAVLLGGLAPTPGGVGVQEAVLAAGLVSAGIAQETAFAIAIAYRIVTFFLPPIWGFFSLRWLEKHDYL